MGPWRSWERVAMALRRSRVQIPLGPPQRPDRFLKTCQVCKKALTRSSKPSRQRAGGKSESPAAHARALQAELASEHPLWTGVPVTAESVRDVEPTRKPGWYHGVPFVPERMRGIFLWIRDTLRPHMGAFTLKWPGRDRWSFLFMDATRH